MVEVVLNRLSSSRPILLLSLVMSALIAVCLGHVDLNVTLRQDTLLLGSFISMDCLKSILHIYPLCVNRVPTRFNRESPPIPLCPVGWRGCQSALSTINGSI